MGEGIQVAPGMGHRAGHVRQHLDVQAQYLLGGGDQVGHVQVRQGADLADLPGQACQPLPGGVTEPASPCCGPGPRGEGIDRFDQAGALIVLEHVFALGACGGVLAGGPIGAPRTGLDSGPRGEYRQVRCPQVHAGSGQQPHHRIAAGGIMGHGQRGPDVGDLGGGEQSAQTDHLARQPGGQQSLLDHRELRPFTAEHSSACRRAGVVGPVRGE